MISPLKIRMDKMKDKLKTPEEIKQWEAEQAILNGYKPEKQPEQLDLFNDQSVEELAAMPNTIARSALFSPIARGRRKYFEETKIASRKEINIKYTGKQLDMADSDVFMIAIKELHKTEIGERVKISRYKLLKTLGRGMSGKEYVWLDQSLKRLKAGVLIVNTKQYEIAISLIDEYAKDKDQDIYYLKFNPKIIKLFDKQQYGLIDWEKRKSISKKVDLTKWMQTYIASNAKGEQFISLGKLKEWCGQAHRRADHFKTALNESLKELERLKIIKKPKINKKNIVTFNRL